MDNFKLTDSEHQTFLLCAGRVYSLCLVIDRPFFYFATDAYWLQQLSDADIDLTLKSIAAKNITVVRTWAFNDVFEIPTAGAWFQVCFFVFLILL